MRSAAIRLDASATPVPAMSNAVPWSGLVFELVHSEKA